MDPLTATTLVTALTLMEKVNVFYTSAWSALITAGTVALVIVGAVVPTLLSMWQQRTFRIEKATLENLMRSEIDRRIDQTREDLASIHRAEFASLKEEVAASVTAAKNTIDGALKSLQEKQQLDVASIRRDLEEESAALRGMISHLLAKEYVRRKEYMDAASNTFDAAHLYAQGRSETNLQRSIAMLLDDALPGMTNADVDAGEIDKKYSMLEQAMKPLNENGRYSDHLSRLRKAIAAAKKRLPVSKSEKCPTSPVLRRDREGAHAARLPHVSPRPAKTGEGCGRATTRPWRFSALSPRPSPLVTPVAVDLRARRRDA